MDDGQKRKGSGGRRVHKATKLRAGDVLRLRVAKKGKVSIKCPEGTEVAIERPGG